jgi:hypothetical protein
MRERDGHDHALDRIVGVERIPSHSRPLIIEKL